MQIFFSLFFILSREFVVKTDLLKSGFRACFALGEGGNLLLTMFITVDFKI